MLAVKNLGYFERSDLERVDICTEAHAWRSSGCTSVDISPTSAADRCCSCTAGFGGDGEPLVKRDCIAATVAGLVGIEWLLHALGHGAHERARLPAHSP